MKFVSSSYRTHFNSVQHVTVSTKPKLEKLTLSQQTREEENLIFHTLFGVSFLLKMGEENLKFIFCLSHFPLSASFRLRLLAQTSRHTHTRALKSRSGKACLTDQPSRVGCFHSFSRFFLTKLSKWKMLLQTLAAVPSGCEAAVFLKKPDLV